MNFIYIIDLPAKYWLKNELSSDDIIKSGFYDIGSSGPNNGITSNFPPLAELQTNPPDKKREVILIDWENDQSLQTVFNEATENLHLKNAVGQLRQIAQTVAKHMGGSVIEGKANDFSFKFQIYEHKVLLKSNVIPIGKITQGTFYHRSLLFKAICDRVGLAPCTLVRGDYNRAWNTVDVRKQSLSESSHYKEPPKDNKKKSPTTRNPGRDQSESSKKDNSRKSTPRSNIFEEEEISGIFILRCL